jgi:hypothetical protein
VRPESIGGDQRGDGHCAEADVRVAYIATIPAFALEIHYYGRCSGPDFINVRKDEIRRSVNHMIHCEIARNANLQFLTTNFTPLTFRHNFLRSLAVTKK